MLERLGLALIAIASAVFVWRRSLRYLRYFQQEEYSGARLMAWWARRRAFDRRGSLVAALAVGAHALSPVAVAPAVDATAAAALVFLLLREEDPRRTGKLKLNMTARAARIHRAAVAIGWIAEAVLLGAAFLAPDALAAGRPSVALWALQIGLFQTVPLLLVAGSAALAPGERRLQARFLGEARAILARTNPRVIAITGSYGKTSTKHVLARMMQTLGPTFSTTRSVNTPMGITREIREQLKPHHRYAVLEMGAYRRGSIRGLCGLVPPHAGIVTQVGIMHLERFGTEEDVYLAKSELARAISADGILVCNGDSDGARRMAAEHPKATTLLYGLDPGKGPLDARISNVVPALEGSSLDLHWGNETVSAFTPLLGRTMLSNILGAYAMARALGADPERLLAVIRTLEPVWNRLEPRRKDGVTYLYDAYNSNPIGFADALDVLASLPAARRILVTPGMIELGPRQAEENCRIAERAARACDLALVVGQVNREPLRAGLAAGGMDPERIRLMPDRDAALAEVARLERTGDLILIENDLPDTYETTERF